MIEERFGRKVATGLLAVAVLAFLVFVVKYIWANAVKPLVDYARDAGSLPEISDTWWNLGVGLVAILSIAWAITRLIVALWNRIADRDSKATLEELRTEGNQLSRDIHTFINARLEGEPDMMKLPRNQPDRAEYIQNHSRYGRRTVELYRERYGTRVVRFYEALKRQGYHDEIIEKHYRHPVNNLVIEEMAERIGAIAYGESMP